MKFLIDRRIGGFGDLMMLSAPMEVLREEGHQLGLVLDRRWHGLFKHWPGRLEETRVGGWDEIFNVHAPCPASVFEINALASSRIGPGFARGLVQANRIEAFSAALGVHPAPSVPVVFLSQAERSFALDATSGLPSPIVYVQTGAAETYKDWGGFVELCDLLERDGVSVITSGPCGHRAGLRSDVLSSIAIMERCDLVASVDSMAVHAAAAVDVPCVMLAGPMNPGSRIGTYPTASSIQIDLPCAPCWRNQNVPCHLTGGPESVCMERLSVEAVARVIRRRLDEVAAGQREPAEKYEFVEVERVA